MRPFDPRLLRYTRSTRGLLAAGVVTGGVQAAAIVAFAWGLAGLVTGLIGGADAAELSGLAMLFAAAVVVRSLAAWLWELTGLAGAARVKEELRGRALEALARLGPERVRSRASAELASIVGPGLDALDGYFARYLPQLLLTGIATPLLVLVIWLSDPLSGLIVTLALPLIPVFMVLIGLATQAVQRRQWDALRGLARAFLEVVGGLSTLIVYGRQHRQAARIRAVTAGYRRRTMGVLRVTFLSGFVLELAGSLSVALVAVSIGLRLVDGQMALMIGLFVLVLTPEVFLPVRNVGAQFHASAEGLTAAEDVFALIEEAEESGSRAASAGRARRDPRSANAGRVRRDPALSVRSLTVHRSGRAIIAGLDFDARPGEVTAIAGESGAGKSTLLAALLGFAPHAGEITLGGEPLDRPAIAWAGQSPQLVAGTVSANVALGAAEADPALVTRALGLAGLADIDGDRLLGPAGSGLSGGQSQRLAIARALYRTIANDCPVLLLDEPSAALDEAAEAALVGTLAGVAAEGRIVIVVSHRPAVLTHADRVLHLEAAALA